MGVSYQIGHHSASKRSLALLIGYWHKFQQVWNPNFGSRIPFSKQFGDSSLQYASCRIVKQYQERESSSSLTFSTYRFRKAVQTLVFVEMHLPRARGHVAKTLSNAATGIFKSCRRYLQAGLTYSASRYSSAPKSAWTGTRTAASSFCSTDGASDINRLTTESLDSSPWDGQVPLTRYHSYFDAPVRGSPPHPSFRTNNSRR